MKHTFASSSRHSASCGPSSVILSICVHQKNLQEYLQCETIFVLRAIHFSIGHCPFVGIFVSEDGFLLNCRLSLFFPDAWNCNYRLTSILG
jgi:hypothetical protein